MRIFDLKMHNSGPIKTVFDVISSILEEANINIYKGNIDHDDDDEKSELEIDDSDSSEKSSSDSEEDNDNSDNESDKESDKESIDESDKEKNKKKKKRPDPGLKIQAMDQTNTALVHVRFKDFTSFVCREDFTFGVNIKHLYKYIKTLDKEETFKMFMDDDDDNQLIMEFENPEEEKKSNMSMNILELNTPEFDLPSSRFDARVIMSSTEFNNVVRQMIAIAPEMEIELTDDKIKFTSKGYMLSRSTEYKNTSKNSNLEIIWDKDFNKTDTPNYFKGKYELKFLSMFSKCHSLSHHVEIFLANNFPILIRYDIGGYGHILFCLAPWNDNTAKTRFEEMKDDYKDYKVNLIEQEND